MKKSIPVLSVVGLAAAFTACATSQNSNLAASGGGADRRIAQQVTTEFSVDKQNFNPVCGRAPDANVSTMPTQIAMISHEELVARFTTRTPVYSCEDTPGDGKGGDWKGFYDRAGDKAQMLNDAILGVGKNTAPYLVAPFQAGKPRSWRQFSDLITNSANEMQKKYGINPSWTNEVLYKYKMENMQNLGYISGSTCTIDHYEEKTYEVRTPVRDHRVVVEFSSAGGKLLPKECETYGVTWNGTQVGATVDSDYNDYAVSVNYEATPSGGSRKAGVLLRGRRKPVTPGGLIEIQGSTAVVEGGNVKMVVANAGLNELQAVPEFANACKLSASVVISGRVGSAWGSKKSKPVANATFALDGNAGSTTHSTPATLKEKEHPVVAISTSFASGCPFFNTSTYKNGTIETK